MRRCLIFGEREVDAATGEERVQYPSLAVLAERHGVSRTLMWKFAHREHVYERRAEAKLKTQARFEDKVIEKLATSRATAAVNVIGVVDQFMARFEADLREGRVKTDSAADFDRLARLRELVSGTADARVELQGGLTLAAIQARHRMVRDQAAQLPPQIAGTNTGEADRVEPRAVQVRRDELELDRRVHTGNGQAPGTATVAARASTSRCVDPEEEPAETCGRGAEDLCDAGELGEGGVR